MSDRDRGRGHGGFHGGVRPPQGVPASRYNQSNDVMNDINRAGPPGAASTYPLPAGASVDAQASYNVMDGMALHIVYLFELSHMECLLGPK